MRQAVRAYDIALGQLQRQANLSEDALAAVTTAEQATESAVTEAEYDFLEIYANTGVMKYCQGQAAESLAYLHRSQAILRAMVKRLADDAAAPLVAADASWTFLPPRTSTYLQLMSFLGRYNVARVMEDLAPTDAVRMYEGLVKEHPSYMDGTCATTRPVSPIRPCL